MLWRLDPLLHLPELTCICVLEITCPALQAAGNSALECSDKFRFQSSCRVICNSGYQIFDPENDYSVEDGIDCKADGTWCGAPPPCTSINF